MTDVAALVDLIERQNRRLEEAILLLERYAALAEAHMLDEPRSVSYLFPERCDFSKAVH